MTLELAERTLVLRLTDPLLIARSSHGSGSTSTTVVIEVRDPADGPDGPVGIGEGYPDIFYGETPATMSAACRGCWRPSSRSRPISAATSRPRARRSRRPMA